MFFYQYIIIIIDQYTVNIYLLETYIQNLKCL